jgi:hypothetical protein
MTELCQRAAEVEASASDILEGMLADVNPVQQLNPDWI